MLIVVEKSEVSLDDVEGGKIVNHDGHWYLVTERTNDPLVCNRELVNLYNGNIQFIPKSVLVKEYTGKLTVKKD